MNYIVTRIVSGLIAIVLVALLAFLLHDILDDSKPANYKDVVLIIYATISCFTLFLLVALKKYPGSLVSFCAWLVFVFMSTELTNKLILYGADYYLLEELVAYLILLCVLIAIGLSRQKAWLKQLGLFVTGGVVLAGYSQWSNFSREVKNELNGLDSRISYVNMRLNGSSCYLPLKDMSYAMVNEKLMATEEILSVVKHYLPDTPPKSDFEKAIYQQANEHGLQVDGFEFVSARNVEFYSESIFKGLITGRMEQYKKFKDSVQNMEWLVSWDEQAADDEAIYFTGKLYDYVTAVELAGLENANRGTADKNNCATVKLGNVWWPPYAARLEKRQNDFRDICMKQKPFENILLLDQKVAANINEILERLEIIKAIARLTNNEFARNYKPDIPVPCYQKGEKL